MNTFALGVGTATRNTHDKIIEAWYPNPVLHPSEKLIHELKGLLNHSSGNECFSLTHEHARHLQTLLSPPAILSMQTF